MPAISRPDFLFRIFGRFISAMKVYDPEDAVKEFTLPLQQA